MSSSVGIEDPSAASSLNKTNSTAPSGSIGTIMYPSTIFGGPEATTATPGETCATT
eukprot:CAMPEP_0195024194 /NCGR_PEP_ID=MMETSP0326_2-20130528/44678_1 /TAXON_ID=2866 ORGANISM="Crypthecodinium cohnii, Strain Seligo" /NCGR_SAMPLE_ID=MMETSP0326_2 /ASSEMBLY_ACC=CAM_ASM_000348 /LENGTH=55 /DNA_ID=CAMNT_0040044905 /DNA_START=26 /DNA_END=190 /DNA_ORIENTATION=+